jgi:hypothetical protein
MLVGTDIAQEDKGVLVFDLLHRTFGSQWLADDRVLVELRSTRNGFALIDWVASRTVGFWTMESGRSTNLASGRAVSTLKGGLAGGERLVLLRLAYW